MNYVKCRWKQALFGVFLLAAYHVYFFFFIQNEKIGYLMYLDTLVFMPVLVFILFFEGKRIKKNFYTLWVYFTIEHV